MKKATALKLENLIRRLIQEESGSGRIVTISGDRGYGEYRVELVRPRPDLSREEFTGEPEEIWEVIVVDTGETEYAIKDGMTGPASNKNYWGQLDPFIKEDL